MCIRDSVVRPRGTPLPPSGIPMTLAQCVPQERPLAQAWRGPSLRHTHTVRLRFCPGTSGAPEAPRCHLVASSAGRRNSERA
eukprot:456400-Alexandrium_andersonii.AAC.1